MRSIDYWNFMNKSTISEIVAASHILHLFLIVGSGSLRSDKVWKPCAYLKLNYCSVCTEKTIVHFKWTHRSWWRQRLHKFQQFNFFIDSPMFDVNKINTHSHAHLHISHNGKQKQRPAKNALSKLCLYLLCLVKIADKASIESVMWFPKKRQTHIAKT